VILCDGPHYLCGPAHQSASGNRGVCIHIAEIGD
jgi:hypothetical protein